jgi:hypothetical protein
MKSYVELVNFAAPGGRYDITPVFASALGFQRLIDDLLAPFESASIHPSCAGAQIYRSVVALDCREPRAWRRAARLLRRSSFHSLIITKSMLPPSTVHRHL